MRDSTEGPFRRPMSDIPDLSDGELGACRMDTQNSVIERLLPRPIDGYGRRGAITGGSPRTETACPLVTPTTCPANRPRLSLVRPEHA
jgi:hypothetical protein